MAWGTWRWSLAAGVGSATTALLAGLGLLVALPVAQDAAPRWASRDGPIWTGAGLAAAVLLGLLVARFVAGARQGPGLVQRTGVVLLALGLAMVASGGALLFALPLRPAVHPGRAPAGDAAVGTLALLVALAGGTSAALGAATAVGGTAWAWWRRRGRG